jgi:hypothetical protein
MPQNKLIKICFSLLFIASFAFPGDGKAASYPPSARKSIEWCDIWISHADETNLPWCY